MIRHDRLNALLQLVMERDSVHVDEVVAELGVSPATARRDLDALSEQQLIVRTRGGATMHAGSSDLPLRYKAGRQAEEKRRIARAAAALVKSGDVVGLNGGTTTTEVAREIAVQTGLAGENGNGHVVVVTNAVNIANELTVRSHLRVVVTGGVARSMSYELTGPLARLLLGEISIGTVFLGVNAVDPVEGASAHDEGEASINTAFVERSRRVVVVADASKLGRTAFARICPVDRIDILITDADADPDVVQTFRDAGVEVQTV
jgi:DeoR family transcriptional regulator, aga operon transcriptional repressor